MWFDRQGAGPIKSRIGSDIRGNIIGVEVEAEARLAKKLEVTEDQGLHRPGQALKG